MKIVLNGKGTQVTQTTLHQLKNEYGKDCEVVIYNGFQTQEDFTLKEGDFVNLIKKGVIPPQDELESLMAARHTPHVHQKVKHAKVGIAGLGGLGSNIAVSLARTGVGELLLVDFDIVEPSNLNRQQYFVRHLGMNKTDAMKELIHDINPYIKVKTVVTRITADNAVDLFKDCDVVCEAFDNPMAKAELINSVLSELPGKKIVSGSGMAGFDSSNLITTKRRMSCLYVCGDGVNEAKPGRGLMAPRVSICAGHEANMVLRLILGEVEV